MWYKETILILCVDSVIKIKPNSFSNQYPKNRMLEQWKHIKLSKQGAGNSTAAINSIALAA